MFFQKKTYFLLLKTHKFFSCFKVENGNQFETASNLSSLNDVYGGMLASRDMYLDKEGNIIKGKSTSRSPNKLAT